MRGIWHPLRWQCFNITTSWTEMRVLDHSVLTCVWQVKRGQSVCLAANRKRVIHPSLERRTFITPLKLKEKSMPFTSAYITWCIRKRLRLWTLFIVFHYQSWGVWIQYVALYCFRIAFNSYSSRFLLQYNTQANHIFTPCIKNTSTRIKIAVNDD